MMNPYYFGDRGVYHVRKAGMLIKEALIQCACGALNQCFPKRNPMHCRPERAFKNLF